MTRIDYNDKIDLPNRIVDDPLIHDQLYLAKGDANLEDLLLQRRQLATTYEITSSIGLSYTFGSMYNNVVNTQL